VAILTFPTVKAPNMSTWAIRSNTQQMRSDLNGVTQTLALPGDIWTGSLTFINRVGVEANALIAFVASLRGRSGRFYLVPPGYHSPQSGTLRPIAAMWASSGVITTALPGITSDTTLITADSALTGADATYYWLQPGDYFSVNGELKMVTASVPAPESATVAISFVPPLRAPVVEGAAITTTNPQCICMLADDSQAQWQQAPGHIYAMTIAVEEALSV